MLLSIILQSLTIIFKHLITEENQMRRGLRKGVRRGEEGLKESKTK